MITVPVKAPSGTGPPEPTKAADRAHDGLRARAEAGNAALVLLHLEHYHTM